MSSQQPVRVGLVGAGHNGVGWVRAYHNTATTNLIAICDGNDERAHAAADPLGLPVYHRLEDMLEKEELDLVSVHTADHQHVEPAVLALQAGKHLMCEKPLANSHEGCHAIVEASRKAPRQKAMCGHVLRFNPIFAEVKHMIDVGTLGRLFYLEGDYIHDLHYQTGWNLTEEIPMVGGGCHPIDVMQWWAGPVVEVQAISNHIAFPEMTEDDCAVALLQFRDGAIGRCTSAYGPRGPMADLYNLSAFGTEGTVVRDQMALGKTHEWTRLPVERLVGHPYEPEAEDIARAIMEDGQPRATVVDGARAVATAFAIQQAIKARRPVAVEQFE